MTVKLEPPFASWELEAPDSFLREPHGAPDSLHFDEHRHLGMSRQNYHRRKHRQWPSRFGTPARPDTDLRVALFPSGVFLRTP